MAVDVGCVRTEGAWLNVAHACCCRPGRKPLRTPACRRRRSWARWTRFASGSAKVRLLARRCAGGRGRRPRAARLTGGGAALGLCAPADDSQVAVLDATNRTEERRKYLVRARLGGSEGTARWHGLAPPRPRHRAGLRSTRAPCAAQHTARFLRAPAPACCAAVPFPRAVDVHPRRGAARRRARVPLCLTPPQPSTCACRVGAPASGCPVRMHTRADCVQRRGGAVPELCHQDQDRGHARVRGHGARQGARAFALLALSWREGKRCGPGVLLVLLGTSGGWPFWHRRRRRSGASWPTPRTCRRCPT